MADLPHFDYITIATDDDLTKVCLQWMQCSVLALDTEFVRRSTFYPILGLIQVSDGDTLYLIDPINIVDFSPFAKVLQAGSVLKLLHSASEDLEVFDRYIGCLPSPMLDTQTAAGMAGVGVGLGFNKLVMALLEVDLPKGETCSDWCKRPLTEQQCQYACADVYYLYAMYPMLLERLQQNDRLAWALADSDTKNVVVPSQVPTDEYYLRVSGAGNLNRNELTIFKGLCDWRETIVRKRDMPRGRFVKDAVLLKIAKQMPASKANLAKVADLSPGVIKHYSDDVLALVEQYQNVVDENKPAQLAPPLKPAQKELVEKLKRCLVSTGEQLDFPSELLASRKDLVALISSNFDGSGYSLPPKLTGWREQAVGQALLNCIVKGG
jgi:ribonuclease D|tara:strand:+ start:6759 stop:7898 length:1140 start_codon:yes stop_codon:yes gene_type:complete